jgi:N-acetylneuraminic acid mutarotase
MLSVTQRVLAVTAMAAMILVLAASLPAQGQQGPQPLPGGGTYQWTKAAPIPIKMEELYGLALDGKMYVVGGLGPAGVPPGFMYVYDPATDTWTKKKDMPRPVHHQAQAIYKGKIYTFGGCTQQLVGDAAVDNSWVYDPAADTWTALKPMPGRRCSAKGAEVNGKIYVIGGFGPMENGKPGTRVNGVNQAYDPETNTWEERSPMPTARNHAFSGVVNGKIYIIGGRLGSGSAGSASPTDVVEEYDPAKDLWSDVKAPMPTLRSGGGDATYNGRIYVAGGEYGGRQFSAAYRALEVYDPASNMWTILPPMPVAKHGQGTVFLGGRLHLAGGVLTPGNGFGPDSNSGTAQHDVLEYPFP